MFSNGFEPPLKELSQSLKEGVKIHSELIVLFINNIQMRFYILILTSLKRYHFCNSKNVFSDNF